MAGSAMLTDMAQKIRPNLNDRIAYHAGPEHADGSPFNEEDWTDPSYKTVGPYVKSKVATRRFAGNGRCLQMPHT